MQFSIIYEYECGMDTSIKEYAPSQPHLFTMTEESNGGPSEWCSELWGGKSKQRKVCGVLTRTQFERFLDDTGLFAEDVETLGSLGAPGFEFGLAPAISFRGDDPEAIQSAYVTPFPSFAPSTWASNTEKNWQRIRRAVIALY